SHTGSNQDVGRPAPPGVESRSRSMSRSFSRTIVSVIGLSLSNGSYLDEELRRSSQTTISTTSPRAPPNTNRMFSSNQDTSRSVLVVATLSAAEGALPGEPAPVWLAGEIAFVPGPPSEPGLPVPAPFAPGAATEATPVPPPAPVDAAPPAPPPAASEPAAEPVSISVPEPPEPVSFPALAAAPS